MCIRDSHLACRLLDDFEFFVAQPDISCVYWAQFNDPEVFGDMVDRRGLVSLDGKEKAAYHAFRIFSEMPADRVKVSISEKSVKGMASFDQKKACLVVWNLENESVKTRICLEHLPIESGKGKVYKIDAWRNSRIDNLNVDSFQPCGEFSFADGSLVLEDELLGESVYYICIEAQHRTAGESLVPSGIKRYYFDPVSYTHLWDHKAFSVCFDVYPKVEFIVKAKVLNGHIGFDQLYLLLYRYEYILVI